MTRIFCSTTSERKFHPVLLGLQGGRMAAATVFACWDGQKRALRGTPTTVQELAAAVRAAHGWSEGALLQFSVSISPSTN